MCDAPERSWQDVASPKRILLTVCAVAIVVVGVVLDGRGDDRPLGGLTALGALAIGAGLLISAVVLPTVRQVEFIFPVGVRVMTAIRTREEDLREAFADQKADFELCAHNMCDDADDAAKLLEAAWADATRNWRGSTTSPGLRIYVLCVLAELALAQLRWHPHAAAGAGSPSPLSALPAEDRIVYVLRDFGRLPRAQIAAVLDMSSDELESRLANARSSVSDPSSPGGPT